MSILIITEGHTSVKFAPVVTILVLYTSSKHRLHLFQVSMNILKGFRVMERTRFCDRWTDRWTDARGENNMFSSLVGGDMITNCCD